MLKKILPTILIILFNAISLAYLLIPTPTLKNLPNSAKSDEPGDTVQLKNVSAYYTNLNRNEVINFYKSTYNAPFLIILNHPPELAKTIIKDTIQSYYFEEFHLPFKESLYINGYEWQNDVFTKPEKRIVNKLIFKGKEYNAKITLKIVPTSPFRRLANFAILELSLISIVFVYKKFLNSDEK